MSEAFRHTFRLQMGLKVKFLWVVNLVVSGKVAKLELGRIPIRQNGGKGKFVILVVSRIRHFTYVPELVRASGSLLFSENNLVLEALAYKIYGGALIVDS